VLHNPFFLHLLCLLLSRWVLRNPILYLLGYYVARYSLIQRYATHLLCIIKCFCSLTETRPPPVLVIKCHLLSISVARLVCPLAKGVPPSSPILTRLSVVTILQVVTGDTYPTSLP
jgi:hypothetical protein